MGNSSKPAGPTASFTSTVNTFGLNLLKQNLSESGSTGLCAPNIYHCLSIIAAGSSGPTLEGFAKALGFRNSRLVNVTVDNILNLDVYAKSNDGVEFSSASSVWHHESFVLEKPWKQLVEQRYHATMGPLEVAPINAFVERETRGKLSNVVSKKDVDQAVLILVTCLYFKAKWLSPFKSASTMKDENFYCYDGTTMLCDLMSKNEKMDYVDDSKFQAVVLPYKNASIGPQWKAAIILPKKSGFKAMQDLVTNFADSPGNLTDILADSGSGNASSQRINVKVNLMLPRFSMTLSSDLIPALTQLGLGSAFEPSKDFMSISAIDDLMINRVSHDLFIEVNEEGTEMAAVTVVSMSKSRGMQRSTEMKVDRPFLFIVFDASTGLSLCQVVVSKLPSP